MSDALKCEASSTPLASSLEASWPLSPVTPSPRACRTVKATVEGERDNKINIIQRITFGSVPFFFSSQGHVRSKRIKVTVLDAAWAEVGVGF